jgi:hypothetical protein
MPGNVGMLGLGYDTKSGPAGGFGNSLRFDTSGKANSWFADIYFQSVVNISLENSSRIYPSLFTNF